MLTLNLQYDIHCFILVKDTLKAFDDFESVFNTVYFIA